MSLPEPRPESARHLPPGPGVFTQEQIRCLEEDGILLPQAQPHISGKRKVSSAFSPPRSASGSSASVKIWGFRPDVIQTFDIPMEEESIEVLEYVGFVPSAARLIYERYIDRPDPDRNPDDLMQYVFGHIGSLKSRRYDNMSHREALRQIGLNLQIQEAITDPRFSHIFGTETLHYWAKDTVQTNYAALFSRQRLLRRHANQRIEYKNKRKGSAHQENLPREQGASQNPAVTRTINMTPDDFRFPEAHVAMQTETDTLNDHISLYKGKAYKELNREESIVNDDRTIDLTPLLTYPGGDTNWDKIAYYWNPEKETAEEYRKYAARRCPTSETCIIRIQVPWSFIHRLRREAIWYSPEWKEYIWTCRKSVPPHREFNRILRADLVISHICSRLSGQIMRIPWQDVKMSITEDDVMRLPSGRMATQWMFAQHDTSTTEELAKEIRGKIHFDIFEAAVRSSTTTT
ncbi:hypothetical protein DTO282E5_4457 [Paecilomyces variotii]|nr:hypothetical protein DTO282E5_4457 [Paecilomyces variotii]